MVEAAEAAGAGLLSASLLYGMRHGIDVDHLAAIADLTGVPERPRRALALATLYAAGHAVVLSLLGGAAILLGRSLPEGVDAVMQRLVGATLIALGLYLAYQIVRNPQTLRLRSKWALAASAARGAVTWLRRASKVVVIEHDHEHPPGHHRHDHEVLPSATSSGRDARAGGLAVTTSHSHPHRHVATLPADPFDRGGAGALATGAIHGIGAETPTQIILFATAAGATSAVHGIIVVAAFVIGLFIANTAIALMCVAGFRSGREISWVYAGLALVTAVLSLAIGTLYLAGRADVVASLLGG